MGGFGKVHFQDLKNKKYALKMHKNAFIKSNLFFSIWGVNILHQLTKVYPMGNKTGCNILIIETNAL